MILVLQNISIEGPGTLGRFLRDRGFSLRVVDLSRGDPVPTSLEGVTAVVVLGGPMNVDDEETSPFLRREKLLLREVLSRDVPCLGICLGAQLLAQVAGGEVFRAAAPEVGMGTVRLTDEGRRDPLFRGLSGILEVFQWHGDTFSLPPGAVGLASSEVCPQQAFRMGRAVYGLQFHVEIEEADIAVWGRAYLPSSAADEIPRMQEAWRLREEEIVRTREILYDNLCGVWNSAAR